MFQCVSRYASFSHRQLPLKHNLNEFCYISGEGGEDQEKKEGEVGDAVPVEGEGEGQTKEGEEGEKPAEGEEGVSKSPVPQVSLMSLVCKTIL